MSMRGIPIVTLHPGPRGYYRLPRFAPHSTPQHLGADPAPAGSPVEQKIAALRDEADEARWRRWERASTVLLVLTSAVSLAASLGWFKPKG
jgi:hypothetical protein